MVSVHAFQTNKRMLGRCCRGGLQLQQQLDTAMQHVRDLRQQLTTAAAARRHAAVAAQPAVDDGVAGCAHGSACMRAREPHARGGGSDPAASRRPAAATADAVDISAAQLQERLQMLRDSQQRLVSGLL
jgi:hypothetical protein